MSKVKVIMTEDNGTVTEREGAAILFSIVGEENATDDSTNIPTVVGVFGNVKGTHFLIAVKNFCSRLIPLVLEKTGLGSTEEAVNEQS